jgi:hypothetical protein
LLLLFGALPGRLFAAGTLRIALLRGCHALPLLALQHGFHALHDFLGRTVVKSSSAAAASDRGFWC